MIEYSLVITMFLEELHLKDISCIRVEGLQFMIELGNQEVIYQCSSREEMKQKLMYLDYLYTIELNRLEKKVFQFQDFYSKELYLIQNQERKEIAIMMLIIGYLGIFLKNDLMLTVGANVSAVLALRVIKRMSSLQQKKHNHNKQLEKEYGCLFTGATYVAIVTMETALLETEKMKKLEL